MWTGRDFQPFWVQPFIKRVLLNPELVADDGKPSWDSTMPRWRSFTGSRKNPPGEFKAPFFVRFLFKRKCLPLIYRPIYG